MVYGNEFELIRELLFERIEKALETLGDDTRYQELTSMIRETDGLVDIAINGLGKTDRQALVNRLDYESEKRDIEFLRIYIRALLDSVNFQSEFGILSVDKLQKVN